MDRTKLIVLLAVLVTMALCLTIFVATQAKKVGTEPEETTQNQTVNENPVETTNKTTTTETTAETTEATTEATEETVEETTEATEETTEAKDKSECVRERDEVVSFHYF